VARHLAGRAHPQRRVLRRPGFGTAPRGAVPDLAGRPGHGLATINWIAEITVDNRGGWTQGDWNRRVALDEFAHHFDGWNYGWLDVPAMLRGARRSSSTR
jgi:hypothetical protein